jgi:integrase/recombinase XerC
MNKVLLNLLEEYKEYQIADENADYEKTIKYYIYYIKECFTYLNIKTLKDLKELNYIKTRQHWLNIKRDEGLSGSSLNVRIVALKSFLNYLMGRQIIEFNIASQIKKYPVNVRSVEVDEDKLKDMLKLVDDNYNKKPCFATIRDKFIINVLLFVGLRNTELRDIKLSDVNFVNGEFEVTGKYSKTRGVYLPSNLMKLYREYLSYRNQIEGEEYLFVSVRGRKLDKKTVTTLVKKISKEVGIEDYVAHSLRHCCCTLLINSGVPIAEVSIILGHSSTNVTLRNYYEGTRKNTKSNIDKNILLESII